MPVKTWKFQEILYVNWFYQTVNICEVTKVYWIVCWLTKHVLQSSIHSFEKKFQKTGFTSANFRQMPWEELDTMKKLLKNVT